MFIFVWDNIYFLKLNIWNIKEYQLKFYKYHVQAKSSSRIVLIKNIHHGVAECILNVNMAHDNCIVLCSHKQQKRTVVD